MDIKISITKKGYKLIADYENPSATFDFLTSDNQYVAEFLIGIREGLMPPDTDIKYLRRLQLRGYINLVEEIDRR
jgi:hypothetical protein